MQHAAQSGKTLRVFGTDPGAQKGDAHIQLHEFTAERTEKTVTEELARCLTGREKHRAHPLHRADAQQESSACHLCLAHESGRLHPGNLTPKESGEAFVQTVRPQQGTGCVIGKEKLAAPDEQGGL